jgi:enoyl-CoA hydratase
MDGQMTEIDRAPGTAEELAGGRLLVWQAPAGVAHVRFNNPARHNAMSLAMWEGLAETCARLAEDGAVRVVVLSGAGGRAFVSGADISEFGESRTGAAASASSNAAVSRAEAALAALPVPSLAAIRGYCIGGGLGIALRCDLRLCSEGSRFAVPAARLGLGYGPDGVKALADVVGPAATADILFTARQIGADEALRLGLVGAVLADDALDAAVDEKVGRIAGNAPLTLRAVKAALQELRRPEGERDPQRVEALVAACFDSADYREGQAAFAEKRKPEFRGA